MAILKFLILFSCMTFALSAKELRLGLAQGYPPYQFSNEKNEPTGIDYEVAKLVFTNAGFRVKFIQGQWETLLFNLYHKTEVDVLIGAEVTPERSEMLDFSYSYYKRKSALFTLKDSGIKKISDLFDKVIAGDVHSSYEKYLGSDKLKIRITKTKSKEESFLKLKEKSVVAVIAPIEVGKYLSRKLKIETIIIEGNDPGTPVAFAFGRGNQEIVRKINASIDDLSKKGKIQAILNRSFN